MSTIRVLLARRFLEQDVAYLRSRLVPDVVLVSPAGFTPEALADAAGDDIDAILGDQVTSEMLERAERLRLVQVPWTGVDRLDLALLRQRGIAVCNSHSNAGAVAEMAIALLLAVAKKIPQHDARLREGRWMRPGRSPDEGFWPPTLLTGKTTGFLGFGAIARAVAQKLAGFDMRFVATDARHREGEPPAPLVSLYPPAGRHEVASLSDVLFVTVPLVDATRGLVDSSVLARMKPTAYLVNTSRGEVVDEDALFDALRTRRIAGAAVDAWYQYPTLEHPQVLPSSRHPFHTLDNLVLSPHRAGFAEGDLPHLADVAANLNRLASGQPLANEIDLSAGF